MLIKLIQSKTTGIDISIFILGNFSFHTYEDMSHINVQYKPISAHKKKQKHYFRKTFEIMTCVYLLDKKLKLWETSSYL